MASKVVHLTATACRTRRSPSKHLYAVKADGPSITQSYMYLYIHIHISVDLSTCPPVHLSVCLPVYLSLCPSLCPSVCVVNLWGVRGLELNNSRVISIHVYICLSFYLSVSPPVRMSVCLPVYLSLCPSLCPSVCLVNLWGVRGLEINSSRVINMSQTERIPVP